MESSTPRLLCDCLADDDQYLRGSRAQFTDRFSPLTSPSRFISSSPSLSPLSLLVSLTNDTHWNHSHLRPIAVSPLPFAITNHPLSSLHLEMEDTRWFEAVLAMYMNYTQAEGNMTFASIVGVYCVNPPADDRCPIGICPNPDAAGTLLRIARKFPSYSSHER